MEKSHRKSALEDLLSLYSVLEDVDSLQADLEILFPSSKTSPFSK